MEESFACPKCGKRHLRFRFAGLWDCRLPSAAKEKHGLLAVRDESLDVVEMRTPDHEQHVRLPDQFPCLPHRGHGFPDPADVRPELTPELTPVAELDVAVPQLRHERRVLGAPGLADLPVEVEHAR